MPTEQHSGFVQADVVLDSTPQELRLALLAFSTMANAEQDDWDFSLADFFLSINGERREFWPDTVVSSHGGADLFVAAATSDDAPEVVTYVVARRNSESYHWQFDQRIIISSGAAPELAEFL